MVTFLRSSVCQKLLFFAAIVAAYPASARADRVDIDDPSVLGPVIRREFIFAGADLERSVAEVRYADGIYSYIYAVASSPYFPGTSCCRAGIVDFAVSGHPLEQTWGAINGSDVYWTPLEHPSITKSVDRITPLDDGFVVVPVAGPGRFTVMYMQSPLRPASKGLVSYTGSVRDWDQGGIIRIESRSQDGVLVPTPEPGSIVLFGLGLAGLVARRYARRHRGGARSAAQDAQVATTAEPPAR